MTLTQVGGAFLIFVLCPLLGGLPLSSWIVRWIAGINLARVGTGNVGVSAAFYHGGRVVGILCVIAEAAKGIGAVLLARHFFPQTPLWEVFALIALVMGRYWLSRGAGTTNVVWGVVAHDPITAGLVFLLSGIGFTFFRERRQGRVLALVLLAVITALRHPKDGARVMAMICLCGLIAWIYQKLPDDLDLSAEEGRLESRRLFRFFRGDKALITLDKPLEPAKVGGKAASLAKLRSQGYPVPRGYVLPAGDDPAPLLAITQPSATSPVVVRSSALDEDTETASAAGLYASILDVVHPDALMSAIQRCFASYNNPAAVAYRRDRDLGDRGMAVIVQQQVDGRYSGVAFSRDPVTQSGDAVLVEALPGSASQVVSGKKTPEQYRVALHPADAPSLTELREGGWRLSDALDLPVDGVGKTPNRLVQQVAYLARELEIRHQGIPQDIEWSYDGERLWLLQRRPITTLQPIWTRKIAAEVIPGAIRPLTWSINRPLTCGVWGEIFTLVLGRRAAGLDFEATATLHRAYAYFNATLLGDIFRRMGLPPESLEFLTRGAKLSRPPLASTLRNGPGLLRLLRRETSLEADFVKDDRTLFAPTLQALAAKPAAELAPEGLTEALLERIESLLEALKRATYYNIMAPLSVALRRGFFKVPETALDAGQNPEVAALADLQTLAQEIRGLLSEAELKAISSAASLMTTLAEHGDGVTLLAKLETTINRYGYLSEVGTDIAVPTWRENPGPVRELLARFVLSPPPPPTERPKGLRGQAAVQRRLDLKGQVNARYSCLLAELRWSFVALETHWLQAEILHESGDLFFLTYREVAERVRSPEAIAVAELQQRIQARKQQYQLQTQVEQVPSLVYGQPPDAAWKASASSGVIQRLNGIGASAGVAEGPVKIMRAFEPLGEREAGVILVVPYTDAGWAPLLAQANAIVAEVGGRLSHGAIVAREYGIPAVMDVSEATQKLHEGQWVRVDGSLGTVEVINTDADAEVN